MKTLVIAIAQSGTTKDTNTSIDLSKKRGAHTMSFLNKRNGDISYLVDQTLYIGDGRDIEIAVPSTKTYVAHIILGYIFTLYISKKCGAVNIQKQLNEILNIPNTCSLQIKKFYKANLNKFFNYLENYNYCFVAYDKETSTFASEEIRIKISECCYRTVVNLDIAQFKDSQITKSIIIYNIGEKSSVSQTYIDNILNNKNFIVLIGDENILKISKITTEF